MLSILRWGFEKFFFLYIFCIKKSNTVGIHYNKHDLKPHSTAAVLCEEVNFLLTVFKFQVLQGWLFDTQMIDFGSEYHFKALDYRLNSSTPLKTSLFFLTLF